MPRPVLISHRKKFIFTKTVKTAGTSVESFFEKYCMPEGVWTESHLRDEHVSDAGVVGYRGPPSKGKDWYNHMPAGLIRDRIGNKTWNEYYKFTVIRNPFDKVISQFYFSLLMLKKTDAASIPEGDEVPSFRRWVSAGLQHLDHNKYFIDGKLCVDKFIRYECLATDISAVCKTLKVSCDINDLPTFKSGVRRNHIPLREYYDKKTTAIIRKIYGWELDNFGYELPDV